MANKGTRIRGNPSTRCYEAVGSTQQSSSKQQLRFGPKHVKHDLCRPGVPAFEVQEDFTRGPSCSGALQASIEDDAEEEMAPAPLPIFHFEQHGFGGAAARMESQCYKSGPATWKGQGRWKLQPQVAVYS